MSKTYKKKIAGKKKKYKRLVALILFMLIVLLIMLVRFEVHTRCGADTHTGDCCTFRVFHPRAGG